MNISIRSIMLTAIGVITLSFTKDTLSGYTVPASANTVCVGDLDLNGFNDIIIGHNYNDIFNFGGISILSNQMWGNFFLSDSVFSFANEWAVATAQLDVDPHPEVLYTRENSITQNEYLVIAFNNDMADTLLLNDNRPGYAIDYLALGDVDGNGFQDIVFACNQGHFWGIFYNFGNRNFSAPEINSVNTYYPSGLAVGDLNNDGRDDIVLCGTLLDVYFSSSTGFQNQQLSSGGFAGGVSISDFDLDGKKDILVNSGAVSTVLIKYRNMGNNTFQRLPDFVFQPACGNFFVTDFNNDGYPDVIYQIRSNTGYILWYNQGNFQLADSSVISVPSIGEPWRSFFCADLDNNALTDIVTVRFYAYHLTDNVDIRFNDGQGHFTPNPIVGEGSRPVQGPGFRSFPNPFAEETTFQFSLATAASVELNVFDLQGRQIICLLNDRMDAGLYKIPWRVSEMEVHDVVPGAYLVCLKIDGKPCRVIKIFRAP